MNGCIGFSEAKDRRTVWAAGVLPDLRWRFAGYRHHPAKNLSPSKPEATKSPSWAISKWKVP